MLFLMAFFPKIVNGSDLDQFLSQVQSSNEDVRYDAVAAIGDLAEPEGIPVLEKALKDSSMLVRHGAAEALSEIGGMGAEDIFLRMLKSSGVEQRRLGVIGLALVGCSDEALQKIYELEKDESWEVRWALCYALGQLGDARAGDALLQASTNDRNVEVQKTAKEALLKLPQQIRWYHSFDAALKKSQSEHLRILAVFRIASANQCKIFFGQYMTQTSVIELSKKFLCLKLNPKFEHELAKKYVVQGIPTILFLDEKGGLLDRIDGLIEPNGFVAKMTEWSGSVGGQTDPLTQDWIRANGLLDEEKFEEAIPPLKRLLDQGRKSPLILLYLGYSYGKVGEHEKAIRSLEQLLSEYPDFDGRDKALYCLALSSLSMNKIDKAKVLLEKLEKNFSDRPTGKSASQILAKLREREK